MFLNTRTGAADHAFSFGSKDTSCALVSVKGPHSFKLFSNLIRAQIPALAGEHRQRRFQRPSVRFTTNYIEGPQRLLLKMCCVPLCRTSFCWKPTSPQASGLPQALAGPLAEGGTGVCSRLAQKRPVVREPLDRQLLPIAFKIGGSKDT